MRSLFMLLLLVNFSCRHSGIVLAFFGEQSGTFCFSFYLLLLLVLEKVFLLHCFVNGTKSLLQMVFHSKRQGILALMLLEFLFSCLVAGYLHLKGIYVKL